MRCPLNTLRHFLCDDQFLKHFPPILDDLHSKFFTEACPRTPPLPPSASRSRFPFTIFDNLLGNSSMISMLILHCTERSVGQQRTSWRDKQTQSQFFVCLGRERKSNIYQLSINLFSHCTNWFKICAYSDVPAVYVILSCNRIRPAINSEDKTNSNVPYVMLGVHMLIGLKGLTHLPPTISD